MLTPDASGADTAAVAQPAAAAAVAKPAIAAAAAAVAKPAIAAAAAAVAKPDTAAPAQISDEARTSLRLPAGSPYMNAAAPPTAEEERQTLIEP